MTVLPAGKEDREAGKVPGEDIPNVSGKVGAVEIPFAEGIEETDPRPVRKPWKAAYRKVMR
jgi:hypothetical protein